jgi:hypothetical protein
MAKSLGFAFFTSPGVEKSLCNFDPDLDLVSVPGTTLTSKTYAQARRIADKLEACLDQNLTDGDGHTTWEVYEDDTNANVIFTFTCAISGTPKTVVSVTFGAAVIPASKTRDFIAGVRANAPTA